MNVQNDSFASAPVYAQVQNIYLFLQGLEPRVFFRLGFQFSLPQFLFLLQK
jgi:hypothetical protein